MKKNYLDAMNEYTESEKKPETNFKKFVPEKPGRKENLHDDKTGDEDPNEENSIMTGKSDQKNRDAWNEVQKTKQNKMTKPAMPPFADVPDSTMTAKSKDKPGLWENIRNKKEREGKKYKPAKPGDPDRPDPEAYKKAQSS